MEVKNEVDGTLSTKMSELAVVQEKQETREEFLEIVTNMKVEEEPNYSKSIVDRIIEPDPTIRPLNTDGAQKAIQIGQKLGRLNLGDDNDERPRKKVLDVPQKAILIGPKLGRLNLGDDNDGRPRKKVHDGVPATQWISIYNARKPFKQRYHRNVVDSRVAQHVKRSTKDGLFISNVSSCTNLWAIIMDAGTSFTSQVYKLSPCFLPKEWIMEQYDKNYFISAVAGSTNGGSLVVMSKGTQFSQQSYKVSESFPLKWINKKWGEGFHVTSMATAGTRWVVVMSRNAGYSKQVVELDLLYSSEGIEKSWDSGYRITCVAATADQAALILSVPSRAPSDETQETLRTSEFPSLQVKEKWTKNFYLCCLCYGRTVGCIDS